MLLHWLGAGGDPSIVVSVVGLHGLCSGSGDELMPTFNRGINASAGSVVVDVLVSAEGSEFACHKTIAGLVRLSGS